MGSQDLFLLELAIVYLVGALTGPPVARLGRRIWRRLRGRRRSDWDGYFRN